MSAPVTTQRNRLTLTAYPGDAKTLVAWNLAQDRSANLAGFTIGTTPPGQPQYYLRNTLRFEAPADHAQVPDTDPNSSVNAPYHKFRWLHVPGTAHQGLKPVVGRYTYVVTPRYFDDHGSLQPLDEGLSASVEVSVTPFQKDSLALAFTRGYVQSQEYVNHFGPKAVISPRGDELLFDTARVAGTSPSGEPFTFADEYEWLGFTARARIFGLLDEVLADDALRLAVFAYDLNEPDMLKILLELAKQGRVRVILDDAALHHSKTKPTPEDEFEKLFVVAANAPAEMRRGNFGRYSHDKVFVVSGAGGPAKVLTGSTNFSVTGFYVNSNHVLVLTDPTTTAKYAELFEQVWDTGIKAPAFRSSPLANERFSTPASTSPSLQITFAPHSKEVAGEILEAIAARIEAEGKGGRTGGNVFFAVMSTDGKSPVYDAVNTIHANDAVFSFGISDSTDGIALYAPGKKTGVLVTGKPSGTRLPPPFNQVPGIGLGHQIHHKFVVCGFDGPDPTVFCGSSNLALGGEQANGDNLLEIHDADVARAFMIEALALVDHFQFLDRSATGPKSKDKPPPAAKQDAAVAAGWFLSTSDRWVKPYYDAADLHFVDRNLFA